MNMQLTTWRIGGAANTAFVAGTGDALRTGGSPEQTENGMEPQPALNLVPTIQQAIANLLTTHEPEFLAVRLRAVHGVRDDRACLAGHPDDVLARRPQRAHCSTSRSSLLFISFGYALIAFYEARCRAFGVSFSNLITDQAFYFQSVLEARAFDNVYQHFDELSDHFIQPDAWSILANLIYWTVLLLIALAKALSLP